jgi:hypothetical protein
MFAGSMIQQIASEPGEMAGKAVTQQLGSDERVYPSRSRCDERNGWRVRGFHSAAICPPFSATDRFMNGTKKTSASARTANSQKQSKYASDKAC